MAKKETVTQDKAVDTVITTEPEKSPLDGLTTEQRAAMLLLLRAEFAGTDVDTKASEAVKVKLDAMNAEKTARIGELEKELADIRIWQRANGYAPATLDSAVKAMREKKERPTCPECGEKNFTVSTCKTHAAFNARNETEKKRITFAEYLSTLATLVSPSPESPAVTAESTAN